MAERTSILRKVYVYSDGSEGRSAKAGWTGLRFELLAPTKDAEGKPVVLDSITVEPGMFPKETLECAIGHGFAQKIGDDLAGIATKAGKEEPPVGEDPVRGFVDYAKDRIESMIENLKAGVWVEEGEGSTGAANVTILFEAIKAAKEKAGAAFDEAATRKNLQDADYRKKASAVPAVKAEVERIKLERQTARAKEASKAAKESAGDLEAI